MDIIDKIRNLIKDCQKIEDVNLLLEYQTQISGYLVFLNQQESEAYEAFLYAYELRRNTEAEYIRSASESVSKAKELACIESKEFRETEKRLEALHYKYKTFRLVTSTFLESLKQKISYLKKESNFTP